MKRLVSIIILALAMISANAQPPRPHEGYNHGQRPEHVQRPEHGRPEHVHHDHHRPPRQHYIECATPEQMDAALNTLQNLSFDDKKLDIAKLCVVLGHFCVDDLAQLAQVFSFDDNRLTFLIFAYDYCPDPQNYYALREAFSFTSNFDKLMDSVQGRR